MTLHLPTPDKTKLNSAPLDVVVCQLKYDTNLAVPETHIARGLHDGLGGRRGRYPQVERVQTQSVSVGLVEGGPPSVATAPVTGWRFKSEDDKWIVSGSLDGTTTFVHDLSGNIIAELNASGTTVREYIWLAA